MSFYHRLNAEKSYRRGIFLFASLAVAGICSLYPVMCFKNYSSKAKTKLDTKVADLEQHQREAEDDFYNQHSRRARNRSHSPPRIARVPHHHQRRRHSSSRAPERYESRRRRPREDDFELHSRSHRSGSAYTNGPDSDRERHHRRASQQPLRRYYQDS